MAKATKSMQSKVAAAIQSGKELTIAQIKKIGLAKPHNAIAVLRSKGVQIRTSTRTVKGQPVTFYSLNTQA